MQRWMLTVNHGTDGVLDRGTREETEGAEDIYSPTWGVTVSIRQALGSGPPTKYYKCRNSSVQLHMWQRMDLFDFSRRNGFWA